MIPNGVSVLRSRGPVYSMHDEEVGLVEGKESDSYLFFGARLAVLCAARFFPCASSLDWMACALTIARISPGKRCSSSVQREVLWTSTPRRSPRISPASLSSLKY